MKDPDARRAALSLLAQGIARPHEVAGLAGASLQLVNYWARHANIDWQRIRNGRLRKAWRKEMRRGARLVETTKA
jgi:hypothetical protein